MAEPGGLEIAGECGIQARVIPERQAHQHAGIPLDVLHDNEKRRIDVKSMNRLDHLKLKSTF